MPHVTFPSVQVLTHTNLDPDSHHAILISVLRGLAAVQVVAAHLRAQLYPSLKSLPDPDLWYQALSFFTGFAHQAVVLFFVLSGWLVGGSLLNKLAQPGSRLSVTLLNYSIDRTTRMWIVLLPVFLLTLALGIATGEADPSRIDFDSANAYSVTAMIGNLVGVQDLAVPRYGGNFALWSLSNEMWYYVLFPLLVVAVAARRARSKIGALVAMLAIATMLNPELTLFFVVWLMGVAASRLRIDASRGWKITLLAVLAVVSVYFRLTGSNDKLVFESFVQDVVFSAAFLALLCCLQSPADLRRPGLRWSARAGEWLASFSFTLYVIHVPLLLAMRDTLDSVLGKARLSPERPQEFAIYLLMLAAIMLAAWLFHLPFEAQTVRLRGWLRKLALPPTPAPAQNIA